MPMTMEQMEAMFTSESFRRKFNLVVPAPQFRRTRRTKEQRSVQFANSISRIQGVRPLPAGFDQSGVGNCGIVAMAIAARVDYNEVFNRYKRIHGHTAKWTGRTISYHYSQHLEHFGAEFTYKTYPVRHMSIRDFAYQMKHGVTYLCVVRGHAFILRSGHYIDQRGVMPISSVPHGMGKFITEVWEIK